jgi:hypothetical protein
MVLTLIIEWFVVDALSGVGNFILKGFIFLWDFCFQRRNFKKNFN